MAENKYSISLSRFITFSLLIVLLLSFSIPLNSQEPVSKSPKDSANRVAFISDTQSPMWIEKLWLKSDNNEEATRLLFSSLLKEPDISAVFHLGDITPMGFFECEWKEVMKYITALNKKGIPVYPAMGNHEYFIFPSEGKKVFSRKFPYIRSSWYEKQIGSLAVVLLNSNFSHLSDDEIKEQQKWYENKIHELDEDPKVKVIILGTHYPPYTNSKVISPSIKVENYFVPLFLKSKKCKIFISGHAHAFEHFQKGGKDFIVAGGGGGLLQPLYTGKNQRYKDLFPYKTQRRMFHYVLCEQKGDSLYLKVKMISPDFRKFNEVYKIAIRVTK